MPFPPLSLPPMIGSCNEGRLSSPERPLLRPFGDRKTCVPSEVDTATGRSPVALGVFDANCSKTLRSSSSIKSRSAM